MKKHEIFTLFAKKVLKDIRIKKIDADVSLSLQNKEYSGFFERRTMNLTQKITRGWKMFSEKRDNLMKTD